MRRLVYAPKAYVFVRSNTQGGRIYNLSPDVVSGEVVRNVNDLSTCSIVLRNRFRKWLKDPSNNMSILMPMDMITIWLQRIAGKPVQVFTGYLDSVPYYQMYPGNTTITGSCTLKRIAYSWFDPGLEWFQNWFNSIGGWAIINPETGEVRNLAALQGTNNTNRMKINDGGFADLIQHFMIEIAGWSPDNVIISDLPANLPKIAAGLYDRVQKQNAISQDALEQLLGNVMGVSATPISAKQQDQLSRSQQANMAEVKKVSSNKNVPILIPVTAALLATGFRPAYAKNEDRAASKDDWGYGMYAMKPTVKQEQDRRSRSGTIVTEGNTVGGVDKSKLSNVTTATTVFLSRMQKVNAPTTQQAIQQHKGPYDAALKGDAGTTKQWIEKALNRTFATDDFNGAYAQAKSMISAYAHPNAPPTQGATGVPTPKDVSWKSLSAGGGTNPNSPMDSADYAVYTKSYRNAFDSLAPYYWMAKTHFKGIHLQNPGSAVTGMLVLGGTSTDLQKFFDAVKSHTEYDTITISKTAGNQTDITTYKSGSRSGVSRVPSAGVGQAGSNIILTVKKTAQYPAWTFATGPGSTAGGAGSDVTAGGANSATPGQFSVEQIGSIGFASAFLAHFTLSSNWLEAQYLTGYKALANDISCLDGVKQFCQSSMRSFMSLPDGKFLAFYPDYFGAHGRKPYWYMYDIEITNGGVMLSDEQLATHVYTIGDTYGNDEQITEMDYIRSAGVVTMDMGVLQGFIRPLQNQETNAKSTGSENLGVIKTVADFLYHYGARPYKEEVPQIRNQFFEFLYAWQRFMQKWAATFQTTLEFTFQPEIMCGGIIGFPQHNLQMYCEQVTHTWDYGTGFQTSATLSSPAAMSSTASGDIGSLPGFALAGNINSVGTPSGS